jgi:hypothetical protein
MIEQGLFQYLSKQAGLVPLIGTSIYPVVMPEGAGYPAIVYQRVSTARMETLEAIQDRVAVRFQFTIWANNYLEAKQIGQEMRHAMRLLKGTVLEGNPVVHCAFLDERDMGFDLLVHKYRLDQDFQIMIDEA